VQIPLLSCSLLLCLPNSRARPPFPPARQQQTGRAHPAHPTPTQTIRVRVGDRGTGPPARHLPASCPASCSPCWPTALPVGVPPPLPPCLAAGLTGGAGWRRRGRRPLALHHHTCACARVCVLACVRVCVCVRLRLAAGREDAVHSAIAP